MTTRRIFTGALAGALALPLAGHALSQGAAAPAGPQTYLFFVFSDPVAGREADYDRWFTDAGHLAHMRRAPGVVRVERWTDPHIELRHTEVKAPRDMILYTVRTERPQAVADAVARLAASGDAWPGSAVATVRTRTYRTLTASPLKGVGGEPEGAKPGAEADYAVLAFHRVVSGQDAEYGRWYDTVHMPELLAHPGVVSGQRGVETAVPFGPVEGPAPYVMLLRLRTRDAQATFSGVTKGGGPPSPSIDRAGSFGFTYRAVPAAG